MLRIQSLWLLGAGLVSLGTFRFCYWHSVLKTGAGKYLNADSSGNLLIYLGAIALVVIAIGTIFLFKKRGLQNRLCFLGMVVAIGLLVLECREVAEEKAGPSYTDGSWRIGIVLPLLAVCFFVLAVRGIRRDQKLLKDLQSGRLR